MAWLLSLYRELGLLWFQIWVSHYQGKGRTIVLRSVWLLVDGVRHAMGLKCEEMKRRGTCLCLSSL